MIAEVPVQELPLLQLGGALLSPPLLRGPLAPLWATGASTSMDSSLSGPWGSARSLQSPCSVLLAVSFICSSG